MTFLAIILGLLPGFAWLFFYLQEELHPEPKRVIALVFLAGIASAVAALAIELFFQCGAFHHFHNCVAGFRKSTALTPLLVLLFAFVEETVKFGAVYFTIRHNKAFDEPVEAMIYTAVGALGFATLENLGALFSGGVRLALVSGIFEIATFRFVGTTLLHTLTSSLVGYCWALGIRNFGSKKFIVYGLILATILHAAFNYLILIFDNLLYPVIFVAIVGFFIFGDFEKLRERKI